MATESGSLAAGGMVRGGSIEGRESPAGEGEGPRGGVMPDGTRRRRKASRDGRIPGDGSGGGIIMGGSMGDLGGGMITGAKAGLAAAGPAGGGAELPYLDDVHKQPPIPEAPPEHQQSRGLWRVRAPLPSKSFRSR